MMSIAAPEQLPGFTSSVCLTPNVVIDTGEIYVIVDAFTGVVGASLTPHSTKTPSNLTI